MGALKAAIDWALGLRLAVILVIFAIRGYHRRAKHHDGAPVEPRDLSGYDARTEGSIGPTYDALAEGARLRLAYDDPISMN